MRSRPFCNLTCGRMLRRSRPRQSRRSVARSPCRARLLPLCAISPPTRLPHSDIQSTWFRLHTYVFGILAESAQPTTRQLAAQPTVFAGHLAPDRHDLILAEAGIHQVDDEQTGDRREQICREERLSPTATVRRRRVPYRFPASVPALRAGRIAFSEPPQFAGVSSVYSSNGSTISLTYFGTRLAITRR
jgi:hypothetical protein